MSCLLLVQVNSQLIPFDIPIFHIGTSSNDNQPLELLGAKLVNSVRPNMLPRFLLNVAGRR